MHLNLLAFLILAVRPITALPGSALNGQVVLKNSATSTLDAIRDLLKTAGIIDDIVDDFTPKCFVVPSYGDVQVEYGTHFNKSDTEDHPSVSISCPDYDPGELTLILTDPDAPSRKNPKWGEMCHWIATVPSSGDDLKDVVEYKPPGPPEKTGYHRYVFLLLEGKNGNLKAPKDRQHWGTGKPRHGVRDWAKKEDLDVIGGNFFFEQNEKQ